MRFVVACGVMALRRLLFRYHGVDGDGRLGERLLLRTAHGSDSDMHRMQANPQTVKQIPYCIITQSFSYSFTTAVHIRRSHLFLITIEKEKQNASVF